MPDDSPEIPPSPPRESYRVKGIIYQGTQLFFEGQVRGGFPALLQEIRDPELLGFIQQKFLPSSFYDVLPVAPLIRYEARAMRLSVPQYLLVRTQYQAEKDIGTIYKFLLKLVSLEQVGLRVPRIVHQLFDFGRTESRVIAPGHIELMLHGWPAVLVEWAQTAFEVYVNTAMRLSGAREASLSVAAATPEPSPGRVPLVTLKMDIRFA